MEATPLAAAINQRHGIPGIAEVVTGNGGLPKVRITSRAATGEIYLHGAHVTSWSPEGAEQVLFLSSRSKWEDGKAIRGGVPICFPWFRTHEVVVARLDRERSGSSHGHDVDRQ
jgi:glucose-6-phosphate 1-epimerase